MNNSNVVIGLQLGWDTVESVLLGVARHSDFAAYLNRYRGVPESHTEDPSRAVYAHQLSETVCSLIESALQAGHDSHSTSDEMAFSKTLSVCEAALNSAIYFWHAPDERNFQFRTFVHFAEIKPEPKRLALTYFPPFFVRITEWGVQLSLTTVFEPFPCRYSLGRACGLRKIEWDECHDLSIVAETIAMIRVVQREFCQLVDEWEHCNSILAVRQFALRKMSNAEAEYAQTIFNEISRARDLLASWCAESAADFQSFISHGLTRAADPQSGRVHNDVQAELVATDALLLAGFQKFYLPASVSRHMYCGDTLRVIRRFARERLRADPDDVSSLLTDTALSLALNEQADWQAVIGRLSKSSLHWSLSSDPSSAVKAVAWAFTPAEHQLITALLIILYHAKQEPENLEVFWLHTIASVVEMPSSFARMSSPRRSLAVECIEHQTLLEKAKGCLQHFESDQREDVKSSLNYVLEFLSSDPLTDH